MLRSHLESTRSWVMRVALTSSIAFCVLAGTPAPVFAQSDNDAVGLEEIVVTARKREESLLEVPLAITAVTGDALAEKGVTTFNQLAEAVPSINISNVSAGRSDRSFQQITLRGFVPSSTLSTLTSIFVDGSPVASGTAVMSVFDPARVEVLKGPQAVYFGRNTFAGAVNIVTRDATDEFGGSVSLMAGQRDNLDVMAAISGPIGERFGFRLAARTFKKDGSYDNGAVPGETLGDQETRTFNLLLKAEPLDNLTIKSMVMYSEDDDGPSTQGMISAYEVRSNNGIANYPRLSGSNAGTVIVPGLSNCDLVGWWRGTGDANDRLGVPAPGAPAGAFATRPYICGAVPSLPVGFSPVQNTTETSLLARSLADPRQRIVSPSQGVKGYGLVRESWHAHLNIDYQFGETGFTLSSLTGINDEYYSEVQDLDNQNSLSLANPLNLTGANTNIRNFWDFLFGVERETRDFSQEFRLSYDNEGPFSGVLGVNYFKTLVWADLISITAEIVNGLDRFGTAASNAGKNQVTNQGVFFGGTYRFNEQFKLSLEGRYQTDEVFGFAPISQGMGITVGALAGNQFGIPPGTYAALAPLVDEKYNSFLPRVIFQWDVNEGQMLYASYSKGVNVGTNTFNTNFLGATQTGLNVAASLGLSVKQLPEKLTNYELGYKASFLDGRMSLQSAYYWGTWTDQLNNRGTFYTEPTTNAIAQVSGFVNSGEAKFNGLEVELLAKPTDHVTVNFAGAMNDTEVVSYSSPSVSMITGVIGDGFKGKQLPSSSKYSFNFGAKYEGNIAAWEDGSWFVRGDLSWKDKLFLDAANITWIKARSTVNLRAGIDKGPLSFEVFALNALNDKNYVSIATNSLLGPSYSAAQVASGLVPALNSVGVANNNASAYINVGLPELRMVGAQIKYKF
jgi:iron complex outermembrane recepter protein